jgi:hypothetical protein
VQQIEREQALVKTGREVAEVFEPNENEYRILNIEF